MSGRSAQSAAQIELDLGLGSNWRPPRGFPLQVRRSKKSRHLRLEIGADAVHVVAPTRATNVEIEELIQEKRDWIEAGVREMRQVLRKRIFPRRYVSGAQLPLGNRRLHLEVERVRPPSGSAAVELHENTLVVSVAPQLRGSKREAATKELVRAWYRRELHEAARAVVDQHGPRLGLRPKGIRVKWMVTRWGSCGPAGYLNLNARLLGAPPEVLEYVVVHELCHLRHLHHQASFWRLVERALPDYSDAVHWLDRNGMRLLVD